MRQIPFGRPIIGDAERNAVMAVLNGPILVHGPKATEFENAFGAWTGAPHCVSTSSCTASLHLAYFYLGIGPGDEVLVPAQTHAATAHAVELTGAKPVFVDAEAASGNIDIAKAAAALTPRTRAISVVHYLGVPVDMDGIRAIAKDRGLFVVEDCALAIGTRVHGVHAGLLGDVGCFSFYPVKHMTTAEGGMITTRSEAIARKIERQRAFGVDRHVGERKMPGIYDVTMLGFNYRMNEIEAAIGIEQVKRLDGMLALRAANFAILRKGLANIGGLEFFADPPAHLQSSYYCFSTILNDSLATLRPEIVARLNALGVGTSVYYPKAVPELTYYREKYGFQPGDFPVASRISNNSIALPVGPHLDAEDMEYIVRSMKKVMEEVQP